MDIHRALTELGLSSNEVKIYLTILDLGMAPMSVISRRAALKRPTTYGVVKKLRKRGLTECFLSKGVRLYSVMPPAALYDRYAAHLQELKDALPQLVAKHEKLLFKPRVHFYEGRGELEKPYADAFATKGGLIAYLLPDEAEAYFEKRWVHDLFRGIPAKTARRFRILSVDSAASRERLKHLEDLGAHIRYVKKSHGFSQEILIHDRHVSQFSFNEGYALRLTSADAVQTQSALFEMAWKNAA